MPRAEDESRRSVRRRLGKAKRFAKQRIVGEFFRHLERGRIVTKGGPRWPPILMTGAARSGTTLVYQSLVAAFRVSYVPNVVACFGACPATAARVVAFLGGPSPRSEYDSRYGKTGHWYGPNQGAAIWRRWFPLEGNRTVAGDLSSSDRAEMAGFVAMLEEAFGGPFVNKWQGHAVHLKKLVQGLPNAVFVWVTRDPLQTAQSVLKARRDLMGDPYKSMSRVPSSYDRFRDAGYIEQVCAYVLGIEADIARDCRCLGTERFYRMRYEDFCRRPRAVLADLRRWYESRAGYRLKPRANIPERFECSRSVKVSREELASLERCLADFDMDRWGESDGREAGP